MYTYLLYVLLIKTYNKYTCGYMIYVNMSPSLYLYTSISISALIFLLI